MLQNLTEKQFQEKLKQRQNTASYKRQAVWAKQKQQLQEKQSNLNLNSKG